MRGQAEFSNARKRMEKQRSETYAHATVDTIKKMLPVWDDLARALEHMPAELEGNTWIEGINLKAVGLYLCPRFVVPPQRQF